MSQYQGGWVLVNFLASWCVPCRQEMPDLERFAAEHSRRGYGRVLGVRYDNADRNLASFLADRHVTWPVLNDSNAIVAYGVGGVPELYLVDPRGVIVTKIIGRVNIAELDRLVAHPPVTHKRGLIEARTMNVPPTATAAALLATACS